MPDISVDPGTVQFAGAMSWLEIEQEIAQAEAQVNKQMETISHLLAEGRQVIAARKQLVSLLEDLSLLKKLSFA